MATTNSTGRAERYRDHAAAAREQIVRCATVHGDVVCSTSATSR